MRCRCGGRRRRARPLVVPPQRASGLPHATPPTSTTQENDHRNGPQEAQRSRTPELPTTTKRQHKPSRAAMATGRSASRAAGPHTTPPASATQENDHRNGPQEARRSRAPELPTTTKRHRKPSRPEPPLRWAGPARAPRGSTPPHPRVGNSGERPPERPAGGAAQPNSGVADHDEAASQAEPSRAATAIGQTGRATQPPHHPAHVDNAGERPPERPAGGAAQPNSGVADRRRAGRAGLSGGDWGGRPGRAERPEAGAVNRRRRTSGRPEQCGQDGARRQHRTAGRPEQRRAGWG